MTRAYLCAGLLAIAACGSGDPGSACGECERGVCDEASATCVDPWLLSCPSQTNQCAADKPLVCDGNPPSYDCGQCGCPGAESCFEAVCFDPGVLALERTQPLVPDDLPTGEYFAFVDRAVTADGMTFAGLVDQLDARLRQDRRMTALLLGETHGSQDEQAVGKAVIRELSALGWNMPEIGVEGSDPILDVTPLEGIGIVGHNVPGDLTNIAHCADVEARVASTLNDQSIYIQYSGSGHTSQEICHHAMHWSICDVPHTSECVTRNGRKAAVVILFDPDIWMWQIDRTLLWRLGPKLSDRVAFEAELESNLARWRESFTAQAREPAYDATLEGRDLNVRVIEAEHAADVYIAYFPRPARPAYMHEAYRAVWNDSTLQDFVVENDMTPGSCSVSWNLAPGQETLWLFCSNAAGFELQATVDGTSFELTESSTQGPGAAASLSVRIPRERVTGSTDTLAIPGY